MSFRIENILKKETTCKGGHEHHESTLKDEARGLKSVERGGAGSILHRRLSNGPYYRPGGENYPIDRASSTFHCYGYDRLCTYPQSYYNFYFDNDYQRLYQKNRFYPMCCAPTSLPTIYPLQYNYYSKRKGGQVRFTANQTDVLEKQFISRQYLSPEDRKTLAESLKLSDRQVKTWFQNRRAKLRRSSSSSSTENCTDANKQNEILNSLPNRNNV